TLRQRHEKPARGICLGGLCRGARFSSRRLLAHMIVRQKLFTNGALLHVRIKLTVEHEHDLLERSVEHIGSNRADMQVYALLLERLLIVPPELHVVLYSTS